MYRMLSRLGNGPLVRKLKRFVFRRNRTRILEDTGFGKAPNEFFLISYPKSGNTWSRILLANLFNESDQEIAFHNVHEYLPDSNHQSQLKDAFEADSRFSNLTIRIIKTHDEYMNFYRGKKVIYLVRNGQDVINSYGHYQAARMNIPPTAQELIRGKGTMPIGPWDEHVLGWKNARGTEVLVIRYEDLLENIEDCIEKILSFIGLEKNQEQIKESIRKSSFDNLKKLELKYSYYKDNRIADGKKIAFVREGKRNLGKNSLSKEDLNLFHKRAGKAMGAFGYKLGITAFSKENE